jgi:MFS superfamily sulfate permease-like transporter
MSQAAPAASREAAPRGGLVRDFTASIVVFLVAMPLCMGIAIASGVPITIGKRRTPSTSFKTSAYVP